MNILVVADHALIRRGVHQILEDTYPECHVQDESSCEAVLPQILTTVWDLMILDLSLPRMSDLDFLDRVRRINPDLPVPVLTMHSEEDFRCMLFMQMHAGTSRRVWQTKTYWPQRENFLPVGIGSAKHSPRNQ